MQNNNQIDAIYARQSIDKSDSISIESQIEFCKYETRGGPYCVYQDKGYSGKNTDRPEFQKMLKAIRSGQIQRVICYKLDRCSRSILDFTNLMAEFQKYGVEFISCTEKFDTSTPMGRAMLNICIVFAQLERETIQQRVLDTYHARSKRGFYMGGRIPLGFTIKPYYLEGRKTARYEVIEEEANILRDMYAIYEKPEASLMDVVKALSSKGIKHPRNIRGEWTRSHIGRILHNPIYVKADLSIYHYFKQNNVTVHNPPEDFIGNNGCYLYTEKAADSKAYHLVIAPHNGIIESAIWLRCRNKGSRKFSSAKTLKNTFLAGKIKCAKCGYALVIRKTEKNGRIYRYFICSAASQNKNHCEGVRSLNANLIEDLITLQITEKINTLPFPSIDKKNKCKNKPEVHKYAKQWKEFSTNDKITVVDLFIYKINLDEETMEIHWKI